MKRLPALFSLALSLIVSTNVASAADNIPATGADGRLLNFGFEDGTLRDWTATGDSFEKQPVKGEIDQNRQYGKGHVSKRQGDYWIGGYEVLQDKPKGTLTSVVFKVTQPWGSFLIGGGSLPGTRVEIVTKDDGKVIHTARGSNHEEMARSVVDLRKVQGREVIIRIVDEETAGWGHVNFDDFVFHAEEPKFAAVEVAKTAPVNKGDPNLKADTIEFAGLPAEKAAQVATVPAGYELKVFAAEPDIINPIAFCMDDRARVWVVEGMTYPQRAKTEPGAPEWLGGKDRILVFEDTDGDGHFDKRTVFMEGLNLVSGIEVGLGGVFVGAAPNLIFIPVENWDAPKPGKVEVLLDGWGYQDTHETLNTFHWGPDGWLYGCHGVFTKSEVGKPGTPKLAEQGPNPEAAKKLQAEIEALQNTRREKNDAMREVVTKGGGALHSHALEDFEKIALTVEKSIEAKMTELNSLNFDEANPLGNAMAKSKANAIPKIIAGMQGFLEREKIKSEEWAKTFESYSKLKTESDDLSKQIKELEPKLRALTVAVAAAPNDGPKPTKEELSRLENEVRSLENEKSEFEKQNDMKTIRAEGAKLVGFLTQTQSDLFSAKKEMDALAKQQDDAARTKRMDSLRVQIVSSELVLKNLEPQSLEVAHRIADSQKIDAAIKRATTKLENTKEQLRSPRIPLNAGIWRYQPQRKEFEVFAHGTSNPWGIDWNADGDLFAEACVIPHLFHIIQGARYQRQAGQHFDPHTYDDIKTIADHRHFLGATPHSGNGKSDAAGGGHAHAGLCIPLHPSWPEGIRGNVLMNNIHGARINMDVLERYGSGYVAHHGADFINFHDKASQIVDLREGPDGTLWMIDWYDLNQCHRAQREAHDYTTGRIFRLGRKGAKIAPVAMDKMGDEELFKVAVTTDEWSTRHARRLLQGRKISQADFDHYLKKSFLPKWETLFQQLSADFGLGNPNLLNATQTQNPRLALLHNGWDAINVHVWVGEFIRAAAERVSDVDTVKGRILAFRQWSGGTPIRLPVVRLALASACQRLTVEQRKPIVLALLAHEEDKDDPNLPLMDWYAAEPIVAADPAWAAEALAACKIPKVAEFIARRMSEK